MAQNSFSMNFLALVVVFLGFVDFSHQQQEGNHTAFMEKMHANHDECIKETGVAPDLIPKAFKDGVFTNDPKLKCFLKCIFQKMGTMDSNGNLDFSGKMDHIPPNADKAKITAGLEKCKTVKGTDACDTAFLAAQCFREVVGPMQHHQNKQ